MKNWSYDFPPTKSDSTWWDMVKLPLFNSKQRFKYIIYIWQNIETCMGSDVLECLYDGVKNFKKLVKSQVGITWLPRRAEWAIPQFCDTTRCK